MPNRFHRWVAAHAFEILLLAAAFTLVALAQLVDPRTGGLRLSVDPSLEAISTQSQEDRDYAERIRRRFGHDEPVTVVLQADDVYSLENLQRIDRLSRALASLEGVASVRSLTATPLPRAGDGLLAYTRVTPRALREPRTPGLLRQAAEENPLVTGQLVSRDGRSAAILVYPEPVGERVLMEAGLVERIRLAADRERAADVEALVTGTLVIREAISATVTRQIRIVVPAVILVITLLLALVFRNLRGVLVPLATIAVALVWVLAVLSYLGRPLNLVTALAPPFIVTMGLAYCAHVLTEYEHLLREAPDAGPAGRVARLLHEVSAPVMVTGLATIAGLLALNLNEQRAMVEFAWTAALGTAFLLLLTQTFVPALLRYCRPAHPLRPLPASALVETGGERLSRFGQRRRPLILWFAGGLFLLSLAMASRIEIGDVFVGLFPADAPVRLDYEAVGAAMGGANPLDVVIEGAPDEAFTDPAILSALDRLQAWLRAQPEVGAVHGLADHVGLLNRHLAGETEAGIPASRDAVRQMLFVGESELLRGVVNIDRSATRIQLRLTVDDTAQIGPFLDRLRARLEQLPPGLAARLTGAAAVMTESVHEATSGQLASVGLALFLIYLCLALQFMSLRVGLLATLPTALQTALYFGIVGMLGLRLNPTTVLVECLILGLAIDDTIHYLARFAGAARRTGSEATAAGVALRAVLRPVTVTKAILALGFLTMVTGELTSQSQFGWLAALTLFCAWLVDILVTPAFMGGLRIVTLWDTLRLDLGDRVQQTIPLFRELNNRQARIFALMSNLHSLPAGTRLITEGDEAGSVYVVIDGELAVFQGQGEKRVELNRMKRGDVVGEIGYFGQARSASVETTRETRLLRFDDKDQERLMEAYPAIAARVFLSLNRIQAQRQARASLSTAPPLSRRP